MRHHVELNMGNFLLVGAMSTVFIIGVRVLSHMAAQNSNKYVKLAGHVTLTLV